MVDNRYSVNAGSVFSLQYRLVWCPKYRKRILVNALEKRLRELLYQKAKEIKAEIHALEIMPDHVRMVVESDPTMAPARLAAQFKGFTSHQLREEFPWLKSYLPSLWSRSYYFGSLGAVSRATVKRYIANQRTQP
jgi:REP-associated tyrosine transposase